MTRTVRLLLPLALLAALPALVPKFISVRAGNVGLPDARRLSSYDNGQTRKEGRCADVARCRANRSCGAGRILVQIPVNCCPAAVAYVLSKVRLPSTGLRCNVLQIYGEDLHLRARTSPSRAFE